MSEPKFKVGDVVQHKASGEKGVVTQIGKCVYDSADYIPSLIRSGLHTKPFGKSKLKGLRNDRTKIQSGRRGTTQVQ